MSLETQLEILNNQLRQILQTVTDGTFADTILSDQAKKILNSNTVTQVDHSAPGVQLSTEEVNALHGASIKDTDIIEEDVEWDNVDGMDCPYYKDMMTSAYTKATTGKSKGCWNKKRSKVYTEEMYLADRRRLMAMAKDRPQGLSTADTAPPQLSPESDPPPQLQPPHLEPASTAGRINDPTADFETIVQRHIGLYGTDSPGCIHHLLRRCNIKNWETYDTSTMEADPTLDKVVPWIRKALVQHHEAESQQ